MPERIKTVIKVRGGTRESLDSHFFCINFTIVSSIFGYSRVFVYWVSQYTWDPCDS